MAMNASVTFKLSPVEIFMGPLPEDERELREKLRSYREAATAMISTTQCGTARMLAWEAIEWLSPWLYAPAPDAWLEKLCHLVSRLLRTAITAEDLEAILREAANA
jgi:hypothetical protein